MTSSRATFHPRHEKQQSKVILFLKLQQWPTNFQRRALASIINPQWEPFSQNFFLFQYGNNEVPLHPSVQTPPTTADQCSSLPLCPALLSAQGVSRTTLMCGDTWQARWPLGLSLITLDPNPSGIKPAKPNSHCGSWLAGICCNCCRGGFAGWGLTNACPLNGKAAKLKVWKLVAKFDRKKKTQCK